MIDSRRRRTTAVLALALSIALAGCTAPGPGEPAGPASPSTAASSTAASSTADAGTAGRAGPVTAPPSTGPGGGSAAPTPGAAEDEAAKHHAPLAGSAAAALATIPVKGRAPKTGYDRVADFGPAWRDVDHNGCDTRDDILARDLTAIVRPDGCQVSSGVLHDPYTGKTIEFRRGVRTSAAVQIDHVVALSNAWQTGAQRIGSARRLALANDPLNLLAVDGPTNESKSDGDAATWLPPRTAFRCTYVARQIAVKSAYGLWVTRPEHDAMARILAGCPGQRVGTAGAVVVSGAKTPADSQPAGPPATRAPKPAARTTAAPQAPASHTPGAAPVHPGAFCAPEGAAGRTVKGTAMRCTARDGDRPRWRSAS